LVIIKSENPKDVLALLNPLVAGHDDVAGVGARDLTFRRASSKILIQCWNKK